MSNPLTNVSRLLQWTPRGTALTERNVRESHHMEGVGLTPHVSTFGAHHERAPGRGLSRERFRKSKINSSPAQKQFDHRKLISASFSEGDSGINFSLCTHQVSIADGDRSRQYVSPQGYSTSCVRSVQSRTSLKASRAPLKSFFSSAS